MALDLFSIVVAAYAATILLALAAEFSPWPRLARRSSIGALCFALVGGAAWCTMVYQRGYIFTPGETMMFAKKKGSGGASQFVVGAGGGGGSKSVTRTARQGSGDLDITEDADAGDGGGAIGSATADAEAPAQSSLEEIIERLLPARPRGPSRPERQRELAGDITRDCVGCPEMVIIAGGSALIGAPESDLRASIAEKPQRSVRFWPGYALSRFAISAEEYDLFRAEHERPVRTCSGPAQEPRKYAVCLTASDAESYAAWLTLRTGKRFRLPTAVEWEYAARTRGTTVLAGAGEEALTAAPLEGIGQNLAEMTSDCFDPYVPGAGRERRVWETNPLLCPERVLKGGGVGESAMHQRFSARRPWPGEEPRWTVGFRVMRQLN